MTSVLEAPAFTLPNPGGGTDLLENAKFTMVHGRRYGLIGRNGKGKSTLLKWVAARRCGNIPAAVSVHYVAQDVHFSESIMDQTAVQVVVHADVERRLLLEKVAALQAAGEAGGEPSDTAAQELAEAV